MEPLPWRSADTSHTNLFISALPGPPPYSAPRAQGTPRPPPARAPPTQQRVTTSNNLGERPAATASSSTPAELPSPWTSSDLEGLEGLESPPPPPFKPDSRSICNAPRERVNINAVLGDELSGSLAVGRLGMSSTRRRKLDGSKVEERHASFPFC